MRYREDRTLSVAGLNRAVRYGLEREWSDVTVLGEIVDLVNAASGHVYFTLSDEVEPAQVRVVMFRSDVRRLRISLENGARVKVRGGLTLYEARGTFQMVARAAQPAGDGNLAAFFQKLIKKLDAEGLFDQARKRPLPLLPRCIGLVTSEHGAAVHDVIRVATARCPVRIVISPCLVQGPEAPASIVRALELIQKLPELDVVIVARGGGSAEDLWAFSDEQVARAIARCRVPVVTGIGHEVDTTIADLVADVRAATPSNAAEVVVPERDALSEQLHTLVRRLERAMDGRVDREKLSLSRLSAKLRDPRVTLAQADNALHARTVRLEELGELLIERRRHKLEILTQRLVPLDPRARLTEQRALLVKLTSRLERTPSRWLLPRSQRVAALSQRNAALGEHLLAPKRRALTELCAGLEALSPLSVLARGYAIAFSERTKRALRSVHDAKPGDRLRLRLSDGEFAALVDDDKSA